MTVPSGLKPLVDGDILSYEIGFGAETGWKAIKNDPEAIPPFWYVEEMLLMRLGNICAMVDTKEQPTIYLTEGKTFRDTIATIKPYKGTRKEAKPWHYHNLREYMKGVLGATVVTMLEADDLMAIHHINSGGTTIICSRDKDLKQVPGYHYSWELGNQSSFGPCLITKEGTLELDEKNKLTGTGLLFFYSQVLTGDTVDNIPGLPKCGPVKAYDILTREEEAERTPLDRVIDEYTRHYGEEKWKERLLEQGQLCWMVRRIVDDPVAGMIPEVWYIGLEE